MSNLIPQLRADKTGKLVTRHVRADPKAGTGKMSIPKPVLAGQKKPEAAPVVNDMDKPVTLGPFNWRGHDRVIDALHRDFNRDESQTVELTSAQWLAARRVGVHDRQIHAFLLAGITDPEEMLEYAQKHDNSLSPRVKPGVHNRRKEWVDRLLEAGVTKDEFDAANKNFGTYGILTLLDNFDFKGDPADAVRMYAQYSNKQTQQALNEFIWGKSLTLDQLKEIGVSRVRKYKSLLLDNVGNEKPVSIDDTLAVIKHEEKASASSAIVQKAESRIIFRLGTVREFGLERAMELRHPYAMTGVHGMSVTRAETDPEELFPVVKHYDDVLHLSILRGSTTTDQGKMHRADFSKSDEYRHLTATECYRPTCDETLEYFRMGLTPEETIEALENGISAVAARGVKEGATPAVASGWL